MSFFQRYPDIFFVKKSEKQRPKTYTGQLEVRSLLQYIAKESTKELNGYDRNGNRIVKTEL